MLVHLWAELGSQSHKVSGVSTGLMAQLVPKLWLRGPGIPELLSDYWNREGVDIWLLTQLGIGLKLGVLKVVFACY